MTDYVILERTDKGIKEVARVVKGEWSGEQADLLKELAGEYPGKNPLEVFHGDRLWAEDLKGFDPTEIGEVDEDDEDEPEEELGEPDDGIDDFDPEDLEDLEE